MEHRGQLLPESRFQLVFEVCGAVELQQMGWDAIFIPLVSLLESLFLLKTLPSVENARRRCTKLNEPTDKTQQTTNFPRTSAARAWREMMRRFDPRLVEVGTTGPIF